MSSKRTDRSLRAYAVLIAIGAFGGCNLTPKQIRHSHHFVPPAPQSAHATFDVEKPPELDLYARERPLELAQARELPQRSLEAAFRERQAERLFESGSALYLQGKQEEGRHDFDQALETLASAPAGIRERAALAIKHERMVEAIHRIEVEATAQNGEQAPVYDRSPLDDIAEMTFPMEPGLKGKVREQLLATVSQLPLEVNDLVLSYINFFASPRGRARIEAGLRRSGRYAAMIRRILDEEGLPQEMIFMAQAESAFLPRAVSRKQATGMWQFISGRGKEYGLQQNKDTDDRLDPEKATRAAARHLRDLYRQFGDWYLAMAAYNCGPMNVVRAIQRTGYADFWELHKRSVLPGETKNYLPIILAMTIVAKNPDAYGLQEIQPDPPIEYDTIELDAPAHLALIADLSGTSLQHVRDMNPAVLKLVAPAGYPVHVPKGAGSTVMAALETIPKERHASWRVHRVNSSDTMAAIARQYNTTAKSIADANGVAAVALDPEEGDVLLIPVAYPGAQAAKPAPKRKPASRKPATKRPVRRG